MSLDVYLKERATVLGNNIEIEHFTGNVTHNLGGMAKVAGLYKPLWRPDEMGIFRAAQLIEPLTKGLELLKSDPARFKQMNPSNGWGSYEGLVSFVTTYLIACTFHPQATVEVSR